MKYLKQFLIIIIISFAGEALNYYIPLPVPASIYGMAIMFTGLVSGIIPLSSVKETGKFLVEIMPVMFIPAGVGIMDSWGVLKPVMLPAGIIIFVTSVAIMAVTGRVSQSVIKHQRKKSEEEAPDE